MIVESWESTTENWNMAQAQFKSRCKVVIVMRQTLSILHVRPPLKSIYLHKQYYVMCNVILYTKYVKSLSNEMWAIKFSKKDKDERWERLESGKGIENWIKERRPDLQSHRLSSLPLPSSSPWNLDYVMYTIHENWNQILKLWKFSHFTCENS